MAENLVLDKLKIVYSTVLLSFFLFFWLSRLCNFTGIDIISYFNIIPFKNLILKITDQPNPQNRVNPTRAKDLRCLSSLKDN